MKDDGSLLTEYVAQGSEDAFRELVSRHAGLVYSAALRQVGQAALAEEVTQAVFCILAQKAAKLQDRTVVAGWLHQTARFAALKAVRAEQRRQAREEEASLMNGDNEETVWPQIAPFLDEAMATLNETDRDAVILRYFEERDLREVGNRLGVSDDAAQKRVSRALDKLRAFFSKRNIAMSTGVIAAALPGNAIGAAPTGLAAEVVTASVTAGAATSSTLNLINETINVIAWTKFKTIAPIAAIGLVAAGTPIAVQQGTIQDLRQENAELRARLDQEQPRQVVAAVVPKPTVSDEELEKLRLDASKVHQMRAEMAKVRDQAREQARQVQQMETQAVRLQNKLQSSVAQQKDAEAAVQREKEKARMTLRRDNMKRMGLAFHQALDRGKLPTSFEDLVANSGMDEKTLNDLRRRTIFFNHSQNENPTGKGHFIILADRVPSATARGDQYWHFTMADGSVLRSTNPPPADGIFRR
ncbi:MAG: sigma-70 family RNA polymerase sigma factor [Limisphaerales bacterium]